MFDDPQDNVLVAYCFMLSKYLFIVAFISSNSLVARFLFCLKPQYLLRHRHHTLCQLCRRCRHRKIEVNSLDIVTTRLPI